jgi:predicted choloylglycine hydrolase
MNRNFACPKPPFSLTSFARRSAARRAEVGSSAALSDSSVLVGVVAAPTVTAAVTTTPAAPVTPERQRAQWSVGQWSDSQWSDGQWSAQWAGGWAAGSWSAPASKPAAPGRVESAAPGSAESAAPGSVETAVPDRASVRVETAVPIEAKTSPTLQFPVTVFGINEPTPGPRWQALFDITWPAYRSWYLSEGDAARPDLATATAALERYMPELMPTYRRLVELAGDDEVAARMLTMWNAPAFLPACSQAVITEPDPVLCRNYDYGPDLWEQTIYTSEFTGGKVIGTGDCLWGLLDGMNDAGLVVSLTFGGRPGSGEGFAIPLVVRYLLEVATTVAQARELLRGLPIAMSYNLTMVDAAGDSCTAFVAPGQEPEFSDAPIATNHHGLVPEFPERAARLSSVPRLERLAEVMADGPAPQGLAAAFLSDPLYNDEFSRSFGTLYTALYRPKDKVVEYRWPDATWRRGFDDPDENREIVLVGR